jgi:hypothetical protein
MVGAIRSVHGYNGLFFSLNLGVVGGGRNVSSSPGPVDVDVLARFELGIFFTRKNTERVSTEIVTLSLQKVRRHDLAPVAIKEGKSCAKCRGWDTPENSLSNDTSPARLGLVNGFVEEIVKEKGFQLRVFLVGRGDISQEDALDDASTAPHLCDSSIVQVPTNL